MHEDIIYNCVPYCTHLYILHYLMYMQELPLNQIAVSLQIYSVHYMLSKGGAAGCMRTIIQEKHEVGGVVHLKL